MGSDEKAGLSDALADAGDRAPFRELYPRLRRYAAVVAPAEVDPDDLVQEALTNLLARGGFDLVDHPEAYLRRSIVNMASNGRRRLGRRRRAVERLSSSIESYVVADYPSELAALLSLDPLDRAVLFLADVEGRSFDEVASLVGIRAETARGRASRARRQLRTQLQADEENHGNQ
jgi:RNA polymerase sigma-70 factor (ECF subfamily)